MWIVWIVLMLIALTIHMSFSIARYAAFDVVASISTSSLGFEIPDVTICPGQRFLFYNGQQAITNPPPVVQTNSNVLLNSTSYTFKEVGVI
ncbi:hypothetical protein Ciccas_005401 [Cichlidogyrus casuarinus]|uniref:Uncharacterized protein n=1 Tax=Cichlidogyrus casuarinus TaxID=1844966 RepID=A0ABD2QB18_9PLAT